MKIDANSIRIGHVLEHNGKLWVVLKTMHTQPGKGGAYMQVEMKCLHNGTKDNVRFRSNETVEKAHLETRELQYLYAEGNLLHLMDISSYEQITAHKDLVGSGLPFLQDGMIVTAQCHNETLVKISLPEKLKVTVLECEPVVKGQTAAASYKPATLENGVRIMVPPFITQGEQIIINSESIEYLERV